MAARESTAISAKLNVSIERMTEHDLLEVVEVEELCGLSPWGWDAYHKELQSRDGVIMLVAKPERTTPDQVEIAGFIVARLIAGELHVNNVAVRPEFRRREIAARLLQVVLNEARRQGARVALLEVRAGNLAAQKLYRRCGFEVTGRRRGYYNRPVEDALLMSVAFESSP